MTVGTKRGYKAQKTSKFGLTLVQYGGMFTTKSVLSGGFDVSSSLIALFLI